VETELLGRPLSFARQFCEERGLRITVVEYLPKRPLNRAEDMRVLRVRKEGERMFLVVSPFATDI